MIEHVGNTAGIIAPQTSRAGTRDASVRADSAAVDSVELSDAARLSQSEESPIRHQLVDHIRAEIADGTYLTDERLNAAIDRLAHTLSDD